MNRIARLMGLAALVFITSSGLSYAQPTDAEVPAPTKVEDGDLPSGWEVLDREVEAIGGAERFLELKSIVATGKFSMAMMGIEGEIVRTEAEPNKVHMNIQLGVMGEMVQASDGETAWMIQPGSTSVTILEGDMADEMLRHDFYDKARPRETYESADVVGIEDVNGKSCYKLSLVSKHGNNSISFFEIETGFRLKSMTRSSPQSEIFDSVTEVSDYREVDGIMHAFIMKQSNGGNEFTITFETVEHDVEIKSSIFAPPPEI